MATEGREQRGQQIASTKGEVKRLGEDTYRVKSQSRNEAYEVLRTEQGWMCSCPDHTYRNVKCKYIWAVEFSCAIRREVETRRIEP